MLFPWKCLVSRVFQSSWQTPVPNFQAMVDSQKTIENPYMLSPVLQPWCNNDWNRRGNMGYHKYDQVGYTSHNFVGIKKDKSLRFAPLICQVNPKSQEFNSNLLNPQIERASKAQCFHIKMSGIYGWSTKKNGYLATWYSSDMFIHVCYPRDMPTSAMKISYLIHPGRGILGIRIRFGCTS